MDKKITVIDALPKLEKKLRVAAYCRVSSGKDAMLHSLSNQISYYNNLIRNTIFVINYTSFTPIYCLFF